MKQQRTLGDISDGKLYDIDDMVAADAGGCNGCSACCHHVGDLVVLTPYDVYEMTRCLQQTYDELIDEKIVLREENKIELPYLKMQEVSERCSFLNEANRCVIHSHRPNICRLFPLGRVYEQDDFKYFLQINSCLKPKLDKVKVRQWIGITDYEKNKVFILIWHQLIKALSFRLKFVRDEEELRKINAYLIDMFYRQPIAEGEDFYEVFHQKLPEAKKWLGIL